MRGLINAIVLLALAGCSSASSTNSETSGQTGEGDVQPSPAEPSPAAPEPAAAKDTATPAAKPEAKEPAKPKPPRYVFATATVSTSSDAERRSERAPLLGRPWCEGKRDDGIGESITIAFAEPTEISSVVVYVGLNEGATTSLDERYNRPTSLTLTLDGGEPMGAKAEMEEGEASWSIEPPQKVQKLALSFAAVEKGKKRQSCLRDLQLDNSDNSTIYPLMAPMSALQELPAALRAVGAAFKECDAKAFGKVTVYPFVWSVAEEGHELPVQRNVRSAKALAKNCESMESEDNKPSLVEMQVKDLARGEGDVLVFHSYAHLQMRWTGKGWKASGVELDLM